MIERTAREIPLFESLGLFTEAPKKKRKPRIISVRPIKKDYGDTIEPNENFDVDDIDDLGDDLSDYESLDIDEFSLDEPEIDDGPEIDSDDTSIDLDDELDDLGDDVPDFDSEDLDDESVDQVQSPSDLDPEETTSPVEGEQQVEEPTEGSGNEVIDASGEDSGEPEDLGADIDITPDDGTDPNTQQVDTTQPETESITKDDMRKYELFKRFMNFYNTLRYFIDKLENGITDDVKFEYASKKALIKFKNLEELTKDYMILKFQSDSFLQNSFFFEKIKASTMLILELLNLNKFEKDKK